jgi:16S rRNA (uracil1498-N3)-methyltransferase
VNLILIDTDEVTGEGELSLSDARAAHLLRVLKVTPGQQVRVGILDGPYGTGSVRSIAGERVDLRCAFEAETPPRPRVDLLLALPRPKVLRRLWAQIAAMGVGRIILTNAERVERNYFDTHVVTPECYRPLLIEGLQQARDTRLPLVSIHRQFKILIEDELDQLFEPGRRVVADPSVTRPLRAAIGEASGQRVLLAIGPEGGFQLAGLGPRTLRTDTACLALLALAHESVG